MQSNQRLTSHNDSPIVVGDTSIPIELSGVKPTRAQPKDETTVLHQAAPGNTDHFHKNAKNHFFVHDQENGNGKDYRAVCFDFASLPKSIRIPAGATSWDISFEDKYGHHLFSVDWVAVAEGEKESGDITLEVDGAAQNGTNVTLGVRVAKMRWSIDNGPVSGPIDPKGRELVTIHCCPDGKCDADPCK